MQILLVALFFVDVKDTSAQDFTCFFVGIGFFSFSFFGFLGKVLGVDLGQ